MGGIIQFDASLSREFKDLNISWLEQYFYVESHDRRILENCQEEIIDKDGHIFFYQENDIVMGTFALMKIQENEFELGKMAVKEKYRGQGIGQIMLQFCIDFAMDQPWEKITLYSNTILKNSIHIYKKYGFQEVPLEDDNPYARGNIKMELALKKNLSTNLNKDPNQKA